MKDRRRGPGSTREMYKGADDKTEVSAYQMLQCKLSAHPRRIRTKFPLDGRSHIFLEEILKESDKRKREIELTISEKRKNSIALFDQRVKVV